MENNSKIFKPYLDFYWQSIAIFVVILILWTVMKWSFSDDFHTFLLEDPIVMLLSSFILFSIIALFFHLIINRTITINDNYIAFKTRLGEKIIMRDDIEYIRLGKERLFQFREKQNLFYIKVNNRRFHVKIRPSAYEEEKEILDAIINFKTN
jgi:hypothetical protein